MAKTEEVQEFYHNVLDVAATLEPESGDKLVEDLGIKPYPTENDNKADFAAAAYGLSYSLADSFYDETGEKFYKDRSEDFGEFALEAEGTITISHFNAPEYIQIANLYSKIAEDSEIIEYTPPSAHEILTARLSEKRNIAFEMLEDLSDELT